MSGKLFGYLNQEAVWGKANAVDEYGRQTYAYKTIKCRMESGSRLILDGKKSEAVSNTTLLAEEEIQVGDTINDLLVLAVNEMTDRSGKIVGREVML